MATNVTFDTKDFDTKSSALLDKIAQVTKRALLDVGNEVLRLSSFEVPHDTGMLQASGSVRPVGDNVEVGYNKVYAARLHEHPEYIFQKGRKGKYLEDPIKRNLTVLGKHMRDAVASALA